MQVVMKVSVETELQALLTKHQDVEDSVDLLNAIAETARLMAATEKVGQPVSNRRRGRKGGGGICGALPLSPPPLGGKVVAASSLYPPSAL